VDEIVIDTRHLSSCSCYMGQHCQHVGVDCGNDCYENLHGPFCPLCDEDSEI